MALVKINRERLGTAGDFMSVNKQTMKLALRSFTHSELRLYLFLVGNKDGYSMPFSKQLIQNEIGLSKNGFYSARDGLIQKGYLVFKEDSGNYEFHETPIVEFKGK